MKLSSKANPMSTSEWEMLPATFGAKDMSRICRTSLRFVQNNAEKLGGHKVAGQWLFNKPDVAKMLGLPM